MSACAVVGVTSTVIVSVSSIVVVNSRVVPGAVVVLTRVTVEMITLIVVLGVPVAEDERFAAVLVPDAEMLNEELDPERDEIPELDAGNEIVLDAVGKVGPGDDEGNVLKGLVNVEVAALDVPGIDGEPPNAVVEGFAGIPEVKSEVLAWLRADKLKFH